MEAEGTTQIIAEIAIAFTGFAGIVGAFGRERLKPDHPHAWLGFWTMIEFGLVTLFAALLPSVLYHVGAGSWDVWKLASSAFALFLLAHLAFVTPLFLRARRGIVWPRGLYIIDVSTLVCLLLAFVSQTTNAFGLLFANRVGGFLLGLYLLLLVSGLNFALLVYLILEPEPESRLPD
jgi:hypothetical protein